LKTSGRGLSFELVSSGDGLLVSSSVLSEIFTAVSGASTETDENFLREIEKCLPTYCWPLTIVILKCERVCLTF
jgi:hypothetical protein